LIDRPELLSFLRGEEESAFDGTLLQEVETAINSYNGMEYGDEEDGRSQVVARDVSETTDYMLTSIMDVFAGSGRVVEFEPTSEGDEDVCDDATEAMHYLYRRKSGYRLIHDWAKAGLLEKIAVVKTCVERKKKRVEGILDTAMLPDDMAGIIEATPVDGAVDEMGEPTHFHVAALQDGAAAFPDYFVPLEEFRVSRDARDLDSAVYLAHLSEKSLSELVEMGFDRDEVEGLNDEGNLANLGFARNDGRDDMPDDRRGALRKVWLVEEYPLFDLNGDGIAERLCVHRVGGTILEVKEVDYQPFEFWCPYPMQGRLIGQSLADKVVDIQRVNTALERNALDSLYMSVAPGTIINEDAIGDNTIEDLLTVRPRRIVRYKGALAPVPETVQDISQIAFQAIEFKTRQRESRTGITRLNKGVDEDTLNDTASGQKALMTRGQQMERYVIRNFAEGVARLFMKKVRLMREHGEPFTIRVDGEYRKVDPQQWPEDMEVNVKVGLGSGAKDERIMYRNMIAQSHTLLMQGQAPICTWENVYNNLAAAAKDAGIQPNDIYTHPDDAPQQQPQPDPAVMKLQGELQLKQQQLQQAQQEGQAKLALMAQQHASENQIAHARADMEANLALRQQNLNAWLEAHQMALDAHKQHHEMQMAANENAAKVKSLRRGGALNK
jgi:hypothetical protein